MGGGIYGWHTHTHRMSFSTSCMVSNSSMREGLNARPNQWSLDQMSTCVVVFRSFVGV